MGKDRSQSLVALGAVVAVALVGLAAVSRGCVSDPIPVKPPVAVAPAPEAVPAVDPVLAQAHEDAKVGLPIVEPAKKAAAVKVKKANGKGVKATQKAAKKPAMSAAEKEAYIKAATNFLRAECLRWAVGRKVEIENQRGTGIQDWGNVREAAICADFIYSAPQTGASRPRPTK